MRWGVRFIGTAKRNIVRRPSWSEIKRSRNSGPVHCNFLMCRTLVTWVNSWRWRAAPSSIHASPLHGGPRAEMQINVRPSAEEIVAGRHYLTARRNVHCPLWRREPALMRLIGGKRPYVPVPLHIFGRITKIIEIIFWDWDGGLLILGFHLVGSASLATRNRNLSARCLRRMRPFIRVMNAFWKLDELETV